MIKEYYYKSAVKLSFDGHVVNVSTATNCVKHDSHLLRSADLTYKISRH